MKIQGTEIVMAPNVTGWRKASLANNPYFSKIENWVATDTGLPVERDYYDLQGKLYKSERFEQSVQSKTCQ